MTARTAAEWRSVDAPFRQGGWQPIPGRCSRCGGRAWRGETRWWHVGPPCPARGRAADFLPD